MILSYTEKLDNLDVNKLILNNFCKNDHEFFWENNKEEEIIISFGCIDKIQVFNQSDLNTIQKKVWCELTKIKIGKTKSYGEIAKKFKLSPRHVGKICGQNKIPLAIPCHRVIRSDGTIGGFSASRGIILKKKLLNFENSWK